MAFTLDKVVPWGRSYQEYLDMFALTEADLQGLILGCGDGPASFNAELTERGGQVVSVDPLYAFDATQINQRISETYATVIAQVNKNKESFFWTAIPSVEELGRVRMAAMNKFLADYEAGKAQDRYIKGELPTLSFDDASFDLALSSHFLFLYSEHLSINFHLDALLEMLRVAKEIRIFPLLMLNGEASPYIDPLMATLANYDFYARIIPVTYEFQRGGHDMLVVKPF
jgi:SAM-dependent methyltransferase